MAKRRCYVWIVEMKEDCGQWHPTVGCALTRDDARAELADWKTRNPDDSFRLCRYYRKEPADGE